MSKITKKDFIGLVATELGGTKKEAEAAINAYHTALGKALATPDTQVSLQGALTFKSQMTKERTMISKLTGVEKEVHVPSKLRVSVKASESLTK